ncbi:LacI family DNA-binding transcriptional regulator [Rhodoglobus sp. NPDC076762]
MSRKSTRAVTRADVARVAGTSDAVVSYVVNNGPRPVSAKTRALVLAAIDSTGYQPNSVARSLASGSTGVYGLVVPDISNPFFAAMAHALDEAVYAARKSLLLGGSSESESREIQLVETFMRHRVDGLLYVGVGHHPSLERAVESGIPVVVLDRIDDEHPASSVVVDNTAGAYAAVEHLIAHGYRDIGIISGPIHVSTATDRRTGWVNAMTKASLPLRAQWDVSTEFTKAAGLAAGRSLLALAEPPRAIFASNDQQAVGLLIAADEAGLSVPEDLAVFAFDGTSDSEFSVPGLSTVQQPLMTIAHHAIAALEKSECRANKRVICDYSLILRRSCGCPALHDPANSRFSTT